MALRPRRDGGPYGGAVTSPSPRGPLALAALASAAVPGLDPVSVEQVEGGPTSRYDVAFVQDSEHRRWVIRCPRSAPAAAQLEQSAALTKILARRLRLAVPTVKGWVNLPEGGRAAVHGYLTGRPVDLGELPSGAGLTVSLGRALATVHNLDPAIYDEAGAPTYEAEAHRARRLADLDRAAATGRVPTGLLSRWESELEDVGRWHFSAVPTVGGVSGAQVLAEEDESGGLTVKGLLGWEDARVADPADDLAEIVGALDDEALDTFLEAYAHTRSERPDGHLAERARLAHEMSLVRAMMAAVARGDLDAAEEHAARMRRLDEETSAREAAVAAGSAGSVGSTDEPTRRSGSTAVTQGEHADEGAGDTSEPGAASEPRGEAEPDVDDLALEPGDGADAGSAAEQPRDR